MDTKKVRNKFVLSQKEFAPIIGCKNYQEVSAYENGRKTPSASKRMLMFLLEKRIVSPKKMEAIYRGIRFW